MFLKTAHIHRALDELPEPSVMGIIHRFCGNEVRFDRQVVPETDLFFFEVSKSIFASEKVPELEKVAMFCALRYLMVEAKRGRAQRDSSTIRLVWRMVHPLLERHQVLSAYRLNEELKQRVLFFLRDGF